jgi:hypothetical protein
MIAIKSESGELLKVINNFSNGEFGFHKLFGFLSSTHAQRKIEARKRDGHQFVKNEWLFKINLKNDSKNLNISSLENCEVESLGSSYKVTAGNQSFIITNDIEGSFDHVFDDEVDEHKWLNRLTEIAFIFTFAIIPILYYFAPTPEEVVEEKLSKKITVKIVKPVNTVKISRSTPSIKTKPLTKSDIAKRAVKRNLGFLGMVGSRDLKKVVGGVPQKLKKATAGAGAGGDAGSGGEVLTGLGEGLKKTTVGNTGTQGLGGVGTKGAGGGAGGYGNTTVASGEGVGVSSIAVSSSELVLEGGLSRYAINATIAKYLPQVRRCYEEKGLKFNSALEGLVTVAFQINGSGRLNFSNVKKSSLNNKNVESCITTKMMGWQFPRPKGGTNVDVDYPFMLRPGQ